MRTFIIFLICTCASFLTRELHAQSFYITGHVVAGGGGTSQGSGFSITGTIGQAEASPRLQNGCWSVDPGFWGAYAAVNTPGAPALRIRPLGPDFIRVSFTPGCGDWVLQWTTTLETVAATTVWTDDPPSELILLGEELARDFHVPSWGPRLFFRLRKP